jgi:hypothetical protein|tara:strand:+ start:1834 stop:2007 length:174 start_codon:yes stop_codon:yes gene_type:complete
MDTAASVKAAPKQPISTYEDSDINISVGAIIIVKSMSHDKTKRNQDSAEYQHDVDHF